MSCNHLTSSYKLDHDICLTFQAWIQNSWILVELKVLSKNQQLVLEWILVVTLGHLFEPFLLQNDNESPSVLFFHGKLDFKQCVWHFENHNTTQPACYIWLIGLSKGTKVIATPLS